MSKSLRIIVGGYIGLLPAGGVTWDYIQYPVGLASLGQDVYYVEDTRLWPIYQSPGSDWSDASGSINHLDAVMKDFELGKRWAYRVEVSGKVFGLSEEQLLEVCRTADVFINISCSTFMRDEYRQIPARVLIDSDPMFTQIQYLSEQMFTPGQPGLRELVDAHNNHFTFGENFGSEDCLIPDCGIRWHTTRQPICLDHWSVSPQSNNGNGYTTLMNWTAAKPLEFDGTSWGQKDLEFRRFFAMPGKFREAKLEVAVGQTGGAGTSFPTIEAENAGWRVLEPEKCAGDWKSYRDFVSKSRGEFSVAKETYVKARTGWFSCRSACYLASGRPVVTQDTAWSKYFPTDYGLIPFTNQDEAVDALTRIESEPQKHSRSARRIAEEYFDSSRVLTRMLEQLN
jgi:hypothetical protein